MDPRVENVIENLNVTAMMIGYPVLFIILFLLLWFGTRIFRDVSKIFNEMRYDRWKRRHAERDWDNIESSWALEPHEDDREPYIPVQRDHPTLVLPEDFHEQLFNYQEERRERS